MLHVQNGMTLIRVHIFGNTTVRLPAFGDHPSHRAELELDRFALSSWHKHQTEEDSQVCELYNMPTSDILLITITCWRPPLWPTVAYIPLNAGTL